MTRFWQALSGPMTVACVGAKLAPEERTLYKGLIDIVGIQMFFELGLLGVLVSQVGHQFASIESRDENADLAQARLAMLIRTSNRWFAGVASVFAIAAIGLGFYVFVSVSLTQWLLPTVVLLFISALTISLSPGLAVLEGTGHRESVYLYRFCQACCGSLVVWMGLLLGFKIWVLPMSAFVQLAWTWYAVKWRFRSWFAKQMTNTREANYSWIHDVIPVQWRMAVITIVGFVATQMFVLIIIRFHSLEAASSLGMTMMVVVAIQSMAMAWVQAKFPVISQLHGASDRHQAGVLWRKTGIISSAILSGAMLVGFLFLLLVGKIQHPVCQSISSWFISPALWLVLAMGCLVNHLIGLQGTYVLARGLKPLVMATVVGYGAVAIAVWYGGAMYAEVGVVWGYASMLTLVALPIHTFAYLRVRDHQSPEYSLHSETATE
ncbi:MAG: hypothetical protein AAF664_08990 [Planctomycetota bacterium]